MGIVPIYMSFVSNLAATLAKNLASLAIGQQKSIDPQLSVRRSVSFHKNSVRGSGGYWLIVCVKIARYQIHILDLF